MKVKTSELIGPALDWAVAKAEDILERHIAFDYSLTHPLVVDGVRVWMPSTNWSQGGPIIEREKIGVGWIGEWVAWLNTSKGSVILTVFRKYGDTPLIAAMRCFVASRLGDEVEVPDELVTGE